MSRLCHSRVHVSIGAGNVVGDDGRTKHLIIQSISLQFSEQNQTIIFTISLHRRLLYSYDKLFLVYNCLLIDVTKDCSSQNNIQLQVFVTVA